MRLLIAGLVANVVLTVSAGLGGMADAGERHGRLPPSRPPADIVAPSAAFPSIQSAIDAVADGGSIRVLPGQYRERLTVVAKRIRLTGSGSEGPRRTELVGPNADHVDDARLAVGLITYLDGGGGVLEGLLLRGGTNGVVGHARREVGDLDESRVVPAAQANALTMRDVAIRQTGRGVLWRAPADLTIRHAVVERVRRHGVVFHPIGATGAASPRLSVFDLSVSHVPSFGVLIFDTASVGCANQLVNANVTLAGLGGIGVFRSGLCVVGGVLSLNRRAGMWLEQSAVHVDGTTIAFTQPTTTVDGPLWGDGISAFGSELTVVNAYVNTSHRAGIGVYSSLVTVGWDILTCNAFDMDVETLPEGFFGPGALPAPELNAIFPPNGGLVCGCGAPAECFAVSASFTPPAPVPPDE